MQLRGAGYSRRRTRSGDGSSCVYAKELLAGLVDLGGRLATARSAPGSVSGNLFAQAQRQLDRALDDLHELALGLHPRELVEGGLESAVKALADRSPVPVDLEISSRRAGSDAEATAYFLCSEALSNIAKHAYASWVAIRITRTETQLGIEVVDDGVGGADPDRGFGLGGS